MQTLVQPVSVAPVENRLLKKLTMDLALESPQKPKNKSHIQEANSSAANLLTLKLPAEQPTET